MDIEKVKNIIQECIKAVSSRVPNCKLITEEDDSWYTLEEEDIQYLNFKECDLRIKPRYRPFKSVKECWEEMQNHLPFGWVKRFGNYTQIITLDNNTITLSNSIGKSTFLSYKDYKQITFADGSVFGVKVED